MEYFKNKKEDFDLNENEKDNENDFNKTLSIKNITFADNKKSIERMNSLNKENNIIKNEQNEISNDIINDVNKKEEGKFDIIKKIEQIEFLDDNFIDNEDIKLNYSDENTA